MKNFSQKKLWINSPSFALISVLALVSLAALTATAFLASARLERQATSSIGSTTRLEMALNSGKACAAQVVNDNSQPDVGGNTHIVTYWRTNWTDELGYPFMGQIKTSGTPGQQSAIWYYFPLFSPAGVTNLNTNVIQTAMRFTNFHQGTFSNDMQAYMSSTNGTNGFVATPGLNHPKCVQIPLLGGRTSPPVGWVYLNQEKRKFGSNLTNTSPAVRIAWFAEDLEGLIDAERMGGLTTRPSGTNSEEISLSSATGTNGALLSSVATFTNNRKAYISYGLLASTNVSGIANPTNARYFASGLRAWAPTNPASPDNGALAWIPAGIPISGSSTAPKGYTNQGYTKFNLNNLATNSGSDPVATIAQVITSNLSISFLDRAGGLTNNNRFDYAKCVAANIVDYIDSDSAPSIQTGTNGYRGCEALPFVSEAAISIHWTNQIKTGPRYDEEIEVVHLVEFWNMFNKPFSGTVNFCMSNTFSGQFNFNEFNSTKTNFIVPSSPSKSLTNPYVIANLLPNEYRVFASPPIRYKVPSSVGAEPLWNKKAATNGANVPLGRSGSTGSDNFSSGWTLSFNNVIYDQAINFEEIQNTTGLKCEAFNSASGAPPRFKAHIPALRLDASPSLSSIYGTGDNRMNFFMTNATTVNGPAVFNASGFDDRGSFGYRNKAWGLTYSGSTNRPDLWLDGGHANSPLGLGPTPGGSESRVYDKNGVVTAKFAAVLAQKTPSLAIQKEAPAYIADAPMTNIFELGRIFDPMQWQTALPESSPPTNILTSTLPDYQQGGGNTLRIGRAEHARFAFTNMYSNSVPSIPNMGMSSAALLDLFCLTNGASVGGGPYSMGGGKINLNTAPAPVLRALAGGILLTNDPAQVPANYTIPPAMAEAFAQGVMRFRSKYPFLTPSHLSFIGTDPAWPNTNNWPTNSVFGNTNMIALSAAPGNTFGSTTGISLTGNDQAAEEWFSKIYALSSCQSHNFRIYVVAQLVATNSSGQTNAIGPLVKKYYHIYARNGSSANGLATVSTYPNNFIYTWQPSVGVIDIMKADY
jgi:hypothetical protein